MAIMVFLSLSVTTKVDKVIIDVEVREMTEYLRVQILLVVAPSSVPSTHVWCFIIACNSRSRGHPHSHSHTLTHMHTIKTKQNKILKEVMKTWTNIQIKHILNIGCGIRF